MNQLFSFTLNDLCVPSPKLTLSPSVLISQKTLLFTSYVKYYSLSMRVLNLGWSPLLRQPVDPALPEVTILMPNLVQTSDQHSKL